MYGQLSLIGALHDHWHRSSPEVHYVLGMAGFVGWIGSVNWGTVLPFLGVAVMTVAGTGMELYRRWVLIRLEIQMRKRQLAELPADKLTPSELEPPK